MSHFLTVEPCDHTAPFCDGEGDCPGWVDECLIECTEPEGADCRWRCDSCDEWTLDRQHDGAPVCSNCEEPMEPCTCCVVGWFEAAGTALESVLGTWDLSEIVRVGRHEADYEYDDGYRLTYVKAVPDA